MQKLKEYLDFAGMLACNVNPLVPSLSDAGFTWRDAMELIGERGAFYCKAYCKRTVYLSVEAYFLLKECGRRKAPAGDAARLLDILRGAGTMDTDLLRQASGMEKRAALLHGGALGAGSGKTGAQRRPPLRSAGDIDQDGAREGSRETDRLIRRPAS